MSHLELVALVVRDYDPAIHFFVNALGFELVEDRAALTNDGRPKRWVVVRPRVGATGFLLARADGEHQAGIVGKQFAGRVGFFLRVDDFKAAYEQMVDDALFTLSVRRENGCHRPTAPARPRRRSKASTSRIASTEEQTLSAPSSWSVRDRS